MTTLTTPAVDHSVELIRPPQQPRRGWRTLVWLIVVMLAFLLGFAWPRQHKPASAQPACPAAISPSASPGAANGGGKMAGGGAAGAGTPAAMTGGTGAGAPVLGAGAAPNGTDDGAPSGGAGGPGGSVVGSLGGGGGDAVADAAIPGKMTGKLGDGLPIDPGGGSGQINAGTGEVKGGATASPTADGEPASLTSNTGSLSLGPDMPDLPIKPDAPGGRVVGAPDFRYDRSALPRYSGGVDKVASAMSLPANGKVTDTNSSLAAILTTDTPAAVTAWYRKQLPPDWVEEAPPPDDEMQQAVKEMNTHPANESPVDAMLKTIMTPQMQQAQAGLAQLRKTQLTMFWPPNRTTDRRSVLILRDKKTGKTVALLGKSRSAP